MNLHETYSKTRQQFPISSLKIIKRTIGGGFFLIFVVYAGLLLLKGVIAGVVAIVLSIPLRWVYETYYFKNYFYEMGDDYFVIRQGVFTKHETIIFYNRIQDIYIDQDFVSRLFGLYDVHISSFMGEAHVYGLNKANAEGLRSALLEAARNVKQ